MRVIRYFLCILVAVTDIKTETDLIGLCHKRSVLSESELKEYWTKYPKNRPFVINFLYAFSFRKRITLKEMLGSGILPDMESVKTISQIEIGSFTKLINLAGI